MEKVVITGATSMLGVATAEECLKNGVEKIYAVVRKSSPNLHRLPDDERIVKVYCQMSDYKNLDSMINDTCNVFYHMAWDGTGTKRTASVIGQSDNIRITLESLRTAKQLGCTKFVATGSQAEYGLSNLEKLAPDSYANPCTAYGISKYAAGRLSMIEALKLDISCIWVRVFSVYGEYDKASSMISSSITRMLNGEKVSFTAAEQMWDYLYSEDAGRALYLIGEKVIGNHVYCLGSGIKRPLKEYIEIMRDRIDKAIPLGIGDIPYPKNAVMNICADIDALTSDTGWKPQFDFEDGIDKTIKFHRGGKRRL